MHGGVVLRALMRSEGLVTLARARGSWKGYRCPGLAGGCASDRDCFGVATLAVGGTSRCTCQVDSRPWKARLRLEVTSYLPCHLPIAQRLVFLGASAAEEIMHVCTRLSESASQRAFLRLFSKEPQSRRGYSA